MKIELKKLYDILDDLLIECENDTIYNENETELSDETLELIYRNINNFILKLKDKIEYEVL